MVQAYVAEGMHEKAVFSLFVRRLPANRKVLLACGLASVLEYLEQVRFSHEAVADVASVGRFQVFSGSGLLASGSLGRCRRFPKARRSLRTSRFSKWWLRCPKRNWLKHSS